MGIVYYNFLWTRLWRHKFWNNLIFLIKSFFCMTKKSRHKRKYLENEKSFKSEIKSIFIIFRELSVAKNCFSYESALLRFRSRSSYPEMFLEKSVLKICRKFTGEHPCQCLVLITLQNSFIEIALWHERSRVNLLYIFRISFPKNTSEGLRLQIIFKSWAYKT